MSDNKTDNTVKDLREGGMLASLWSSIFNESGASQSIKYLTKEYGKRHYTYGMSNPDANTRAKTTILKNIKASNITWKVFIDLIFNFLNVRKITIVVKLTHADNSETINSITRLNSIKNNVVKKTKDKK